jgi:hypothetical protein
VDFPNILSRWKNSFSQLFSVHSVSEVSSDRNTYSQTVRPSEVEIAIAKLKKYKSQGTDQILAELIEAGSVEIHKHNSIWNKQELLDQWQESIILPIFKKGDKLILGIIVGYYCYQLHSNFIQYPFHKDKIVCR